MNFFECPHCGGLVEIVEINCGIFRHSTQVGPHAPKEMCDKVTDGCGKPFEFKDGKLIICDYK